MKIQILGTGCPKCQMLTENTQKAVEEMGLSADIEKVQDIRDIAAMGVALTPALAVDGVVKSTGRLLSPTQIQKLLA